MQGQARSGKVKQGQAKVTGHGVTPGGTLGCRKVGKACPCGCGRGRGGRGGWGRKGEGEGRMGVGGGRMGVVVQGRRREGSGLRGNLLAASVSWPPLPPPSPSR